jgi:hypothetical protein
MTGAQTTINNELKAVAATAMETTMMTATMTTMRTKATGAVAAAWQHHEGGNSLAAVAWQR